MSTALDNKRPDYEVQPVHGENGLTDVRLLVGGKAWSLGGRDPLTRERAAFAEAGKQDELPVVVGSGLGLGLFEFLDANPAVPVAPVAVVDKEAAILAVTGVRERLAASPHAGRVEWIDEPAPEAALRRLSAWQSAHGGKRMRPVALPLYERLDPAYYGAIRQAATASAAFDFWGRARAPRFQSWPPRILLLTSGYFLMGELIAAMDRMGWTHRLIDVDAKQTGSQEFVERLLKAAVQFRPDFVLTVNHLGVDREGLLLSLLEKLNLPLASWFVDNPHLVLRWYQGVVSPAAAIFTWDADNVDSLRAMGFAHVAYLPLGVDARRFSPEAGQGPERISPDKPSLRADVTFVGNSMVSKVAGRLTASRPNRALLLSYREMARGFGHSSARNVAEYLDAEWPQAAPDLARLTDPHRRLAFEALLTWEATRLYRLERVKAMLPFTPLIIGDRWWKVAMRGEEGRWRWHPEVNYYAELPRVYRLATINFNCTSQQMKGAVNQRVFDVPASGGFVLTDHREQMEQLFEVGKEIVAYRSPEEATELAAFYLKNDAARLKVVQAGRRRVLAEHDYERRMVALAEAMRGFYGAGLARPSTTAATPVVESAGRAGE